MSWFLAGLALAVTFLMGAIAGIVSTMYLIRKGIREADIAPEDRRMMQDTLGIRP